MQNTTTCSLDDAQLQTRASSFVIAPASMFLANATMMALLLHVAIYQAQQVIKPIAVSLSFCMSPPPVLVCLTSSPHSLGLSSSPGSGGCSRLRAPLRCAGPHVCMSDTARSQPWRPPGGGSDRAKSGGGGWTEAEPPALRNQMLRGVPPPRQDRFRLPERTHGDHTGKLSYKITKCITTAYIITYNNVHI